jgi:trehalose utilization protein
MIGSRAKPLSPRTMMRSFCICNLASRELPEGDLERIWVIHPSHPIAEGLPPYFEVPQSEMYGEPFDVPAPGELIFFILV